MVEAVTATRLSRRSARSARRPGAAPRRRAPGGRAAASEANEEMKVAAPATSRNSWGNSKSSAESAEIVSNIPARNPSTAIVTGPPRPLSHRADSDQRCARDGRCRSRGRFPDRRRPRRSAAAGRERCRSRSTRQPRMRGHGSAAMARPRRERRPLSPRSAGSRRRAGPSRAACPLRAARTHRAALRVRCGNDHRMNLRHLRGCRGPARVPFRGMNPALIEAPDCASRPGAASRPLPLRGHGRPRRARADPPRRDRRRGAATR